MNKRIKKKIKKRLGCFRYKDYDKLVRFNRGFYKWVASGGPIGVIETTTITRGNDL